MDRQDRHVLGRYMEGPITIAATEEEYVRDCTKRLKRDQAWSEDYARDVCELIWREFAPKPEEQLEELLAEEGIRSITGGLKRVDFCGRNQIEGVAIPWHKKSVSGAYFTPETRLRFAENLPLLYYEHGRQSPAKSAGQVYALDNVSVGQWMRAQLELRSRYEDMIRKRIEEGKLAFEPGLTVVRTASDGAITSAVVPEVSLVPVDRVHLGAVLAEDDLRRFSYHSPAIKSLLATL